MKKTAKVLMQVLGVTALVGFGSIGAACAASTNGEGINEVVLFKIHDVVPEKDANGKVLYCSAGATFFNRTKTDIANASESIISTMQAFEVSADDVMSIVDKFNEVGKFIA